MADETQLSLFGAPPAPRPPAGALLTGPALPEGVHLGTSSWTFEGWKGLVYHQPYKNKAAFTRDSLAEYTSHPLFRTVGIDASHYAPLTVDQLTHYARQLPPGFRCLQKVWEAITLPAWPRHPRYGDRAGQPNPAFLDAALFADAVLGPNLAAFEGHLGPLVLEFSPMLPEVRPSQAQLLRALDAFFSAVPRGPLYAVELRNRELLTPAYLDLLRAHNVCHVANLWSFMPTPAAQRRIGDLMTGPAFVSRLLLTPGNRYEERVEAWSPFDRLQQVDLPLRGEIVDLVVEAVSRALPSYVIVNNKFEGCAPRSVLGLAEAIAARLAPVP